MAVYARDARAAQQRHRDAIAVMKPAIDNKWGRIQNGSWSNKRPTYPHIRANLKRAQLDDERARDIENENFKLLEKLSKILERSQDPTLGTREWGEGMRLTATQVPVIDHCVPAQTTTFGAAIEAGSLNFGQRAQQQMNIVMENHKLVKRIQASKPTYDRSKQLGDARERERWLINQAIANRPLDQSGGAPPPRPSRPTSASGAPGRPSRPQSAAATLERPRLVGTYKCASAGSSASGGAGLVPVGGPSAASGPPAAARKQRPATARPAKLERRPSELSRRSAADASVLKVLDMLAAQRTKIGSLRELRQQKEVLMEAHYSPPTDLRVEMLSASDVVINVTTSPRCKPAADELLVLVHGGLFMSGSARTCQHLAYHLCDLLGIAVATPVLRLAPEHPYPAALDDLKAAYDYLATYGLDPSRTSPPPTKIGLFAESSGGNLAACLIQSLLAAAEPLPACLFMSSPWLDLSCEGGSFDVNEAYDLMMRKDRMVGIATAYLAGAAEPDDPKVSPLRAPRVGASPSHFAFPPTLIHVCQNELLLDDAINFTEYARAAGADVTLQECDQVLHGWHTYFPVMPQAEQHLREVARFFETHLLPEQAVLDALAEANEDDSD